MRRAIAAALLLLAVAAPAAAQLTQGRRWLCTIDGLSQGSPCTATSASDLVTQHASGYLTGVSRATVCGGCTQWAAVGSAFVTVGSDGTLTAERSIVAGAGLTGTDGGANSTWTAAVGAGTCLTANADDVAVTGNCLGRAQIDEALLSVQTHATDCTSLTCDAGSDGEICCEQDADVCYYCDGSGTPAWKQIGGGGSSALLDSTAHSDTLTGTVVRGDLVYGNSTPKWARLAKGAALSILQMDSGGNEPAWATNIDLGTATWQTGADTVVSYAPVECIKGTDAMAGVSWGASLSSGHYAISLGAGATTGAPFGCNLTVPSSLHGVAVKVREVVLYYALTGTASFDETTLYVETVSAGTFVDVERHTADITSGTSYTYTGTPVTLAAGEALQVSGIGKTPVGSTITLRGWKVTYDTD